MNIHVCNSVHEKMFIQHTRTYTSNAFFLSSFIGAPSGKCIFAAPIVSSKYLFHPFICFQSSQCFHLYANHIRVFDNNLFIYLFRCGSYIQIHVIIMCKSRSSK